MQKKYTSNEKPAATVKEAARVHGVKNEVHYATPEMLKDALARVKQVHGAALEKLAK